MPRCSHCGKVNREGSLFCQDCGHRLEPAAPAKPAAVAPTGGAVCSSCGTANPPGMNFCKMCGTSLAAKAPLVAPSPASVASASNGNDGVALAATAAPAASGKQTCPACGKQTPSGFSFCQHCGQRLGVAPAAQAAPAQPAAIPRSGPAAVAATVAQLTPTPPAGMPRANVAGPVTRDRMGPVSEEQQFAKTMAPTPEMMAQVRAASQMRPSVAPQPVAAPAPAPVVAPKPVVVEPFKPDTLVDEPPATAPMQKFGTLIAVNRDGSDGDAVVLSAATFDIGRTEGSLNFPEDPYLAIRHVRLIADKGKVVVRPIDSVNGVYLRVQGSSELAPGDQFLVGKELIRYEPLAVEERDPPSLVEHGVRMFGSAPREAWGRLRQITVAGTTRDVWHLVRPELVLGREEGDVTFPDDEFMSRRHAAVKKVGGKTRLEDLNSSNGTFVRIRQDRELKPGDVLRMGDQLMRFEP